VEWLPVLVTVDKKSPLRSKTRKIYKFKIKYMPKLDTEKRKILSNLIKEWSQHARIVYDDDFESFNTDENVDEIVSEIENNFDFN